MTDRKGVEDMTEPWGPPLKGETVGFTVTAL